MPVLPPILAALFIETLQTDRFYFIAVVITVVVSVCLHELSHGVAAIALGDNTPVESGHMTLNPVVHMGVVSIVLLFLVGIAWGAMPVNPSRLRGRYAPAVVAIAGPACNVVLAAISIGGVGLWQRYGDPFTMRQTTENLQNFLWIFGVVNIALAIFNMLPVPPLDGSRVLANLSRGYDDVMQKLSTGGGTAVAFILVFLRVLKCWLSFVGCHSWHLFRSHSDTQDGAINGTLRADIQPRLIPVKVHTRFVREREILQQPLAMMRPHVGGQGCWGKIADFDRLVINRLW
jgi:Zn-dependent protease